MRRDERTLSKSASYSEVQRTVRLCAVASTAKTKEMVHRVRKLSKTKHPPETLDVDVHCGFGDSPREYIFVGAEIYAVEDRIQPIDEEWLQALWPFQCFPKSFPSDTYDHMTLFLDSALDRRDHVLKCSFVERKRFTSVI